MDNQLILQMSIFVGAIALLMSLGAAQYVEVEGLDAFEDFSPPEENEIDLEADAFAAANIDFVPIEDVPREHVEDVDGSVVSDVAVTQDDVGSEASVRYSILEDSEEVRVVSSNIFLEDNVLQVNWLDFDDEPPLVESNPHIGDNTYGVPLNIDALEVAFPAGADETYLFYVSEAEELSRSNVRAAARLFLQVYTLQADAQWFNYLVAIPLILVTTYIFIQLLARLISTLPFT